MSLLIFYAKNYLAMRWIISVLMMVMSIMTYSQTYPKLTVIGTDSLCVLTMPQVRTINEKLVELNETEVKLAELVRLNDNYKLAIRSLNRQLELESMRCSNLDVQVSNLNEQYDLSKAQYKEMKRKYITISGISIAIGLSCLLLAL